MNATAPVRYSVEERLATIVLAQPATHNAFSRELVAALNEALDAAFASDEVSCILLAAEGRSFSAGGDLRAMEQLPRKSHEQIRAEGEPIAALFRRMAEQPKPVVAAIQGAAIGGGCALACAAAISIAADQARFGCPELQLGIFPFLVMPALRAAVGDRRALELALTARTIEAAEAAELGLVSRVVPSVDLAHEALRTARRIAAFSPSALRLGLQAFRESTGLPAAQSIERNLELRSICCGHPHLAEGVRAFMERRPARWV